MFRFNGRHCDDLGVIIDSPLILNAPQRRKDKAYVPFRDGYISYDNRTYDEISLSFTGHITKGNVDEVKSWLKGKGRLYLDYKVDRFKIAEILNEVEIERITNEVYRIAVLFTCQPFDYTLDGEKEITIPADTAVQAHIDFNNPGNYESEPIIKIIGTGTATIQVTGTDRVIIAGLTGQEIIVDVPRDIVYSSTQSYDSKTIGKLPLIRTGAATVTITCDTLTKASIIPNWRYL